MIAHTFNPSTQRAQAGVQGQSGLRSEFQTSQSYVMKPSLKNKTMMIIFNSVGISFFYKSYLPSSLIVGTGSLGFMHARQTLDH